MPEIVDRLTRAMAKIFAWWPAKGWRHSIIVVIILAFSSAAFRPEFTGFFISTELAIGCSRS